MKLEFAGPTDEIQIKRLLTGCQLPIEDLTPAHLSHFLMVCQDEQAIGVIGLELLGRSALLRSLAVLEGHRGQGWGKQLVKEIEAYAGQQGVEQLCLLTTTAADFFSRYGYQTIDRDSVPVAVQQTAEFQSVCPASAVCMIKSLGSQLSRTKKIS